jgi:hypothetical protein
MKNKKNAFVWFCTIGITFLLAGVWGCDKADSVVDDPQTAIIGKWRLVAQGLDEDHITAVAGPVYQINIYSPDGEFQSFYGSTNVYEEYELTYQTDSAFIYFVRPPNVTPAFVYEYTFINRNTLKLTCYSGFIIYPLPSPIIYIYKRIK